MMLSLGGLLAVLSIVPPILSQLEWSMLHDGTGNAPELRRDAAIGYDSKRHQLVLFGGRPGPLFDTWICNLSSLAWRPVNVSLSPEARFSAVSGVSGNYFYLATGEGDGKEFFDDIWRFDFRTETWEELPAQTRPDHLSISSWRVLSKYGLRPEARYGSAGGIFPGGQRFYVSLGFAQRRFFDTLSYDVDNQGWYSESCGGNQCNPYDPRYPHARCLHSGTLTDKDEIVIFGGCLTGGETGGPCPAGDSWLFDGNTRQWTQLDGCPSSRTYSSMAMLPVMEGQRRVVLYGGIEELPQVIRTSKSTEDEVALLDPATKSWSIRKTVNTTGTYPVKRGSASLVSGPGGIYMFGGISTPQGDLLNDLWLLSGDSVSADRAPVKPCPTHFVNMILLHGIFMSIGWGFFLLWGVFTARYLKTSNNLWFYVHVAFQVFGLICAITGLVFAILSVQFDHFKFTHGIVGLIAMSLGILQPINAFIRPRHPDPGESRSLARKVWEFIHHFGGRSALLLALVNCSLGVFLALATFLIWVLWFSYLGFVFCVFLIFETVRGFRRDKVSDRAMDYLYTSDKPGDADQNGRTYELQAYDNPTSESIRM